MRSTNRPLTVVALMLSLFMAALEATVVTTAMPTVVGDLGGIHIYSWVFNAYLLTSTVWVPIYGKLSDLYGRKPILLFGISVFLIGSIASGLSTSMWQLIAFRAIQGLGAGAMQTITITVVGDIFNIEERGRMQGFFGGVWAVAGLIGPLLGGLIVDHLSWPWAFWINVPFGLVTIGLLVFALHERVEKKQRELDIAGAVLLTIAVTALLVGSNGGDLALYAFAASAALLVALVYVEQRAAEPILPIPVFKRAVIAVSSGAGALVGGAMFVTMTYVPLFVQGVLGATPTEAGTTVAPMLVGWPIAGTVSGRLITRVGYRPLIRLGLGVTATSALALAMLAGVEANLWALRVVTLFFGVGLGLANTALLIAVQASVEWRERGIVTASTMFCRTIGGALAIGVTGGVLRLALARDPSIPPDAESQLLGPDHGRSLDPSVVQKLSVALEDGLGTILWINAAIAVGAFLVALLFPVVKVPASSPPVHIPSAPVE